MSQEQAENSFGITFAAFLVFFYMMAAVFEKYKPLIGHETSATVILGCAWSGVFFWLNGDNQVLIETYSFNEQLFFGVILPPLIFNSGFSMKRKKFFENIGNIMIFGLVVTLVCFVIFTAASYLALAPGTLMMFHSSTKETLPIQLNTMHLMLFTSLLCSSDVVAAVSIVDYQSQPKLYSCIFGEGVFNDIVSIVLFNTVLLINETSFKAVTPFIIFLQFFSLAIVSIAIGVAFGFTTSLMIKHMRSLTISAVTETFIMFIMGFMAYFTSNATKILGLEMSGIISLLTCSIIQSHYTWYNLSPQGKATSVVTYAFLGHTAEAAVYSYVGISLYNAIPGWWSFDWIAVQMAIIIFGRIVGVFCTFYLFRLCFKKKTISFKELCFITYGGMIRGAIAFALVLVIPHECVAGDCHYNCSILPCYSEAQYELAKSTTLSIVMLTTLIFGTFMKVFQHCLLGKPETAHSVRERGSIYESIQHPNMEEETSEQGTKRESDEPEKNIGFADSKFAKWFGKFDEQTLRPFLIRNYTQNAVELQDAYNELLMTEFNDKDPTEMSKRVDEMASAVRKMTIQAVNRRGQGFGQDLLNANEDFFTTRESSLTPTAKKTNAPNFGINA